MQEILSYALIGGLATACLLFVFLVIHTLISPCVHACTLGCFRRDPWSDIPISQQQKKKNRSSVIEFENFCKTTSNFDEPGVTMVYQDYPK